MENEKKNVETVDIDNPAFADALDELEERILAVLNKIYDSKEFKSGDITLKLTLGVDDRMKEYPMLKSGDVVSKKYEYKGLGVKYGISTVLKKQEKSEGEYLSSKELVKKGNGEYVEVPVLSSQMDMFGGDGNAESK